MSANLDYRIWESLENWRKPIVRSDFTQRVLAEARAEGKQPVMASFLLSRDQVRPMLAVAACLTVALVAVVLWKPGEKIGVTDNAVETDAAYRWDDLIHASASLEDLESEDLDLMLFISES